MSYFAHYSVLKDPILDLAKIHFGNHENIRVADLTLGGGGHSLAFLRDFPQAQVTSFDQDPEALKNAESLKSQLDFTHRWHLVDSNFENIDRFLGEKSCDLILLDAGVSSHHLDNGLRGFSLRREGPLDMRMNPRDDLWPLTAEVIVNEWDEEELLRIITDYGEERFARNIVNNIVEKREEKRISTTLELEDIVFHSYPSKLRHGRLHPSTKTFQALRIAVNRELDVLEIAIKKAFNVLDKNGLLMVISFHSLEDRIVKWAFKEFVAEVENYEILTKKPILPSKEEISENSRSRSAKLRVLRRIS
jgi:16S rRNA (cytosine1402-N4)-methyltransferase